MKYIACLFDFDGVIGDTMHDNFLAWQHAFKSQHMSFDRDTYFQLEGLNAENVARRFLQMNNRNDIDWRSIVRTKETFYLNNHSFALYPGIREFLTSCKKCKHKLALVTGAGRERLTQTVDSEIFNLFDAIVTGDQTEKPKPSPDPYLTAASQLCVAPADCIVFENAPLGIASAKSAGMGCVAIASTLSPTFLDQADYVVDSAQNLSNLMKRICDD